MKDQVTTLERKVSELRIVVTMLVVLDVLFSIGITIERFTP